MWARAQALALGLGLLLLPLSLGESADVGGSGVRDGREDGVEAAGAPAGLARFPRFFNSRTMRVTQKDDPITHGYAAFIPAARPAYDARLDSSLPLARRINAGYRLPNVFRPGEWAPLRRFCAAPPQEENANGQLMSTRAYTQPVSWFTLLKSLFGRPDHCTSIGDHFAEDPLTANYFKGINSWPSPIALIRAWAWEVITLLPTNWLIYPYLPWVPWKPWRLEFSVLPSQHVLGSVCHFMHDPALRPPPSYRPPFFRSWSRKITRTTPSDRDKDICAEWPIWSAPVSTYDVTYPDRSVCLILAGEVTLTPHDARGGKSPLQLKAGDLVVIPEGNTCTWAVSASLMMHYNFGF